MKDEAQFTFNKERMMQRPLKLNKESLIKLNLEYVTGGGDGRDRSKTVLGMCEEEDKGQPTKTVLGMCE
jgi:hypothetical protein